MMIYILGKKYVEKLLAKVDVHYTKHVSTPLVSRKTLSTIDGVMLTDATKYRMIIGSLQ